MNCPTGVGKCGISVAMNQAAQRRGDQVGEHSVPRPHTITGTLSLKENSGRVIGRQEIYSASLAPKIL